MTRKANRTVLKHRSCGRPEWAIRSWLVDMWTLRSHRFCSAT